MNPAATQPTVLAPPIEPVRAALGDPVLRDGLLKHALAILGRNLTDRPISDRLHKANEALQETYVRALQKCPDYDPTRPVGPWLHGIVNNVLSETTRSLRRSPAQEFTDKAEWEQLAIDLTPAAVDAVPQRLDAVGYLAKLPSEHQEVLRLRFYDDLSHDEIACRLGTNPGSARVRLCRALNAARVMAGVDPREDRP